jgi:Mrp family chromosome partitioning ATPase
MEANALREFLADTRWGTLDVLLVDLPPGTDRLSVVASLLPRVDGAVVVTIPSDMSQLVVRRSITAARDAGVPILGRISDLDRVARRERADLVIIAVDDEVLRAEIRRAYSHLGIEMREFPKAI